MYEFYVTIVGATQGRFHGESTDKTHPGWLIGLAYDQPMTAAATSGSARSRATGLQPVRFTRQWGAASPQFAQALATSEELTQVVFEFVRSTEEGEQKVFHRVTLHGAAVAEIRAFIDLDAEPSSLMPLPPLEDIAFSYRGITIENIPAGTVAAVGEVRRQKRAGTAPKSAVRGGKTASARKPARPRG